MLYYRHLDQLPFKVIKSGSPGFNYFVQNQASSAWNNLGWPRYQPKADKYNTGATGDLRPSAAAAAGQAGDTSVSQMVLDSHVQATDLRA